MTSAEHRNFIIQCCLIVVYVLLAILFSREKKTWGLALYYVGCFVKDSGVLLLGYLLVKK